MTSFARKLYLHSPAAAEDFHKAQSFEHRLVYGKHATLAPFDAKFDAKFDASRATKGAQFTRNPEPMVQFGKRNIPPVATAYECWAPELQESASSPMVKAGSGHTLQAKVIVWAQNSFEARKQYAAHFNIEVSDVASRRVERSGRGS